MTDCLRLMEPHRYYFRLVDFIADWGMNVLTLHFSDDHGFGTRMPGFEMIAMRNAFRADEISKLVAHAAKIRQSSEGQPKFRGQKSCKIVFSSEIAAGHADMIDLEVKRVVDGRLKTQYAPALVVNLNGIPVHPALVADCFVAYPAAAQYFAGKASGAALPDFEGLSPFTR